jgi:hypothetical protein
MLKDHYKEIVQLYLAGENTVNIGKRFNTYNTSIRRVLIKYNIPLRDCSEAQTGRKESYFDITDEVSQYWFGFMVADGCLFPPHKIAIALADKDREHLAKYAKFMGNLRVRTRFHKKFEVFEAVVSSSHKPTYKYLESLGITPRKSMTIELKTQMTSHILRGIFDGDGCCKKSNVRNDESYSVCYQIFTGSNKLKEQISEFLHKNDIAHTLTLIGLKKNLNSINIMRQEAVSKFYDLLYKDATVYLGRKRLKALEAHYMKDK